MNAKSFLPIILLIIVGIFHKDIRNSITYFQDELFLSKIQLEPCDKQYPKLTLLDFLKTKQYINNISLPNTNASSTSSAIYTNARIGEALGFLTENVKSQDELIQKFPYGVINIQNIVDDLKTKKIIAPYGEYNNNYLTNDNAKIIYSDDSDLAGVTYKTLKSLPDKDLSNEEIFTEILAQNMKAHWLKMKESGDYGKDGLYYGKRGYSKNTLLALSKLSTESISSKEFDSYLGNGSMLRAWGIGLDKRFTPEQAYEFGAAQSAITHPNNDIKIAAGTVSYLFSNLQSNRQKNKKEIAADLIKFMELKANSNSSALKYLKLGVNLADRKTDPILVFNKISGFTYNELLALLMYSFLYFDNYSEALTNIIHTTGDNDTVAFVLGALFGLYNGIELANSYLEFIEPNDYTSLAKEKTIYFVRHGESQWNESMIGKGNLDLPLSHKGIVQANTTAQILKKVINKETKIISSPLLRASQTCKIFCNEIGCDFQLDSRLIEKSFDIKTAETEEEFEKRIDSFAKQEIDSSELIFAHGLVFQKLQKVLGISQVEKLNMGGIAKLTQSKNGTWSVKVIH